MNSPGLVGVVTVTYNSATVLCDFMASVSKQSHPEFILYLVDNASSDSTLALADKFRGQRVTVIRNHANVGIAQGNNIGIRAALHDGCSSVLLINNDTVFDATLFSDLADGLLQYECDMVVPKILHFDDPQKIWSAGGYFSGLRNSALHYGYNRQDDVQFNVPKVVAYSPTCCTLIKRKVFDRVGLMDANYFVYFDDTDFCLRAYRSGVRMYYLPSAVLRHRVGSLTNHQSTFTVRYYTRNHVYYTLKNYPRWRSVLFCFAYYPYISAKYLLVMHSAKFFRVAQDAFWEGIALFASRMPRSSRAMKPTGA
jgi:GT2 family glycosyltransferase